ncbi:hypothetical protein BMS3Bbin02_01346 [bacterium BMS3Bbin02]|nr:hypothetical protein BMS3Bbin02_01346 [bacterium BMS3Bbin02]
MIKEGPTVTESDGCALSTQTGGTANGGRSLTVADPTDCSAPKPPCTAAFGVYFNGKQGVLTAGHCATVLLGVPQGQHFVTDTVEGLDLRCVNPCSVATKGYFPNYTSAEYSATRSYAALRPYYNDYTLGWDDYAVWRERYASTQPSGELYIVPGGTAGLNGFFGGFFHITSFAKDSQFPNVGTWVCQGAGNLALRGGLHCGFIENNPGITFTTTTHRSVDIEWGVLSKPGGGEGSSGGPWFYDNIGLGIHTGVSTGPNFWGSFERIEPVFIQLQQVSSTTKLYCMSSATGGSTVTCVP